MDGLVGTRFDSLMASSKNRSESGNRYRHTHTKGEVIYYRIEQEPPNVRYFIRWTSYCNYSILTGPDGTILSWRFEGRGDSRAVCTIS